MLSTAPAGQLGKDLSKMVWNDSLYKSKGGDSVSPTQSPGTGRK